MALQDPTGWLKKQLDANGISITLERRAADDGNAAGPTPQQAGQPLNQAASPCPLLSLPGFTLDAVAPVFAILENITVNHPYDHLLLPDQHLLLLALALSMLALSQLWFVKVFTSASAVSNHNASIHPAKSGRILF